MKIPKIEHIGFIGAVIALMLAFFYLVLGISGMMSVLGIMLLFILPFYLILNNLQNNLHLEQDEKIVFSFFIGVGIFPSIAYWLGMLISFRLSIFVTFAVLVAAWYLIGWFIKRNK